MAVELHHGLVCVYNTHHGRGRVKTPGGVVVGYIAEYTNTAGRGVYAVFQHNPVTGYDDLIGERFDFRDAMGLFDDARF